MTSNKVKLENLAYFILLYCEKNEIQINHFKLQKLLYYIQAWHLVYFDKHKIFDEAPEAWVNGPVYRSIYNEFKDDRKSHEEIKLQGEHKKELDILYRECSESLNLTKDQWDFLGSFMNHYGLMSHEKLILLTHKEKPWQEARKDLGHFDPSDKLISLDTMYEYYNGLLKK